jgi:2-succinyl-6-hydroxy-2,4-cyclohexadiene-1-carboxylate synthase
MAPPDLLLLHGFTHTGASWDPVIAALPERYRARAPDIRGHGSAGASRPVTVEAVLGDLVGLAPEPMALCGYSMGGRIALHAALAPALAQRVERLVLIGASPGVANPAQRDARRAADDRLAGEIERSTIEEFAVRWAAETAVLAGQPQEALSAAHSDRLRNTPEGLAAALRGLGTGALPSLWDRLASIACPVTLIVGERDEKFREIAVSMARALAHARVVVVPDAGHAVHLEAPARVAELLEGDV